MVGEGDYTAAEGNLRFQTMSLLTLQEMVETYVINLYEDANLCAVHIKRDMLLSKYMQLAHRIHKDMVKYLQFNKKSKFKNNSSYLGKCSLITLFIAGKNCFKDGGGSGSPTVGQLEVFTLTHQLKLSSSLCDKVIMSESTFILLSFTVLFLLL